MKGLCSATNGSAHSARRRSGNIDATPSIRVAGFSAAFVFLLGLLTPQVAWGQINPNMKVARIIGSSITADSEIIGAYIFVYPNSTRLVMTTIYSGHLENVSISGEINGITFQKLFRDLNWYIVFDGTNVVQLADDEYVFKSLKRKKSRFKEKVTGNTSKSGFPILELRIDDKLYSHQLNYIEGKLSSFVESK